MKSKLASILFLMFTAGTPVIAQTNTGLFPFKIMAVITDETKQSVALSNQVAQLFVVKNYDKLEELAAQFRSSKEQMPNGWWKLDDFYTGFTPSDRASEAVWEARLTALREWTDA